MRTWEHFVIDPPVCVSLIDNSGGYYTVKARDKLRIVCINTNYCARLNPWSLYNPVDPANQLKWLSEEWHKAEQ